MEKLERLSNEISIFQDDEKYCFTSDAILLSRFATVKKGDVVCDLCSGSGVVGFNLYALNKEKIKSLTFFELQKPLYDLSVKSIEYNGLSDKFFAVNTPLQKIDKSYNERFSLAVCNPPYMSVGGGFTDANEEIALCRTEKALTLDELIQSASKVLKYGGRLNLVHRADRTAEIFSVMQKYGIEPKTLQAVSAKGKAPYLVLIEGVKGGKSGLRFKATAVN